MDTLLVHMKLKKATFLSGDVHYSFVNKATYTNKRHPPDTQELKCLQLTSSALRNTPKSWRMLEVFLANWAVKTRSGHCSPETLPWWERHFVWRLFRYDIWKMEVRGIPGRAQQRQKVKRPWWKHLLVWRRLNVTRWKIELRGDLNWITSRPNVALVYLQEGEVVKQVLLSGDKRENNLTYDTSSPSR